MVYILCLVVVFMGYLIYSVGVKTNHYVNTDNGESQKNSNSADNKRQLFLLSIIFLYLLTVVGLRHVEIGWDTTSYRRSFEYVKSISSLSELISYRTNGATTVEWGFLLFEWLSSRILPFQFFLCICALLYLAPVASYIRSYSKDVFLSSYIFITYGMYIFCFSTIRQSIAMGISVIAASLVHKNKVIKAILLVILAFTFHRTALIFAPALLYDKIKLNRKTIAMISAVAIIVYWKRSVILTYMLGYARNNGGAAATGGFLQYLFVFGLVILGVVNWKDLRDDRISVFLFISQCFVLIIIPVLRVSPTYFRVYYYDYLFVSVYIPNLLSKIKNKDMVMIVKVLVVLIGLYYYYNQVVKTNNPLLPYRFYWQ